MHVVFMVKSAVVTGLLALVAVIGAGYGSPAQAGGGGCHQAPQLEGTGTEVALRGSCFVPLLLTVEPGTHVTFTNEDGFDHVVWGGPNMAPGEAALRPGASATRSFAEPGIYPYYCNLHYAMTGVVVVGDGKFVNHAGSDGFASSGSSSAPAVQAAQPRTGDAAIAPAAPPRVTASTESESETWPLLLGGVLGVVGLTAGASLATFGITRRR